MITTDDGSRPPSPVGRTVAALLIFLAAAVLWLLMITRSGETLFFEPTSAAVSRAAQARGPVIGFAIGCVVAVALLARVAGRIVLLTLAIPAALMIMLQLFAPGSASSVICVAATGLDGAFCAVHLLIVRLSGRGEPVTIRVAAALTSSYAATLCLLVALLLAEQLTGTGHVGRLHLTGLSLRGLVVTMAGLTLVALLLGTGSALLGRPRSTGLIVAPLLCLFVIGVVGEVVDVTGGHTTGRSNAIGAGILILIILPVVLLTRRSARQYLTIRPLAGRHP